MMKRAGLVKTVYSSAVLIITVVSTWLFVWDRIEYLRMLNNELEITKNLYQIKEINYANAGANKQTLDGITDSGAGLTDIADVTVASLYIGELLQKYGLAETGFNSDRHTEQTDNPEILLVQTKVSFSFIGEYKAAVDFLYALRDEKYAYFLNSLKLSSSGMPANHISVAAELLIFSTLPSGSDKPDMGGKTEIHIGDYEYENPFYYIEE